MKDEIICITESIEVHPGVDRWSVVRNGSVYATYNDVDYAKGVAKRLAEMDKDAQEYGWQS